MNKETSVKARAFGIGFGHDSSRKSAFYMRFKRKKRWFETEEMRDQAVAAKIVELRVFGTLADDLTRAERVSFLAMKEKAETIGASVSEIFDRGVASMIHTRLKPTRVNSAVDLYLKEIEARKNDGVVTGQHYRASKHILFRFKSKFGHQWLGSVERTELRDHLVSSTVALNTRWLHSRSISALYNWAIQERMVEINPTPSFERPNKTPSMFTVEQVKQFFAVQIRLYPDATPMYALQFFAGMRPAATQQLCWESVNFEEKVITIPCEICKLREPSILQDFPNDQIWDWLRPYASTGRIAPLHWKNSMRLIHHELGYDIKNRWPADVARHTFASHLMAIWRSLDRVAGALCHTGKNTLLRHYLVKNVPRSQGEEYFALRQEDLKCR